MNNYQIPDGFQISSGSFDLREGQDLPNQRTLDACLIFCEEKMNVAAVFAQNIFAGAPIVLNKKHLKKSGNLCRAVLINTVFSNAGTGKIGEKNAARIAENLAKKIGCESCEILLASTGKIGPQLPVEKFKKGIPSLLKNFDNDLQKAARAILTTDLREKISYEKCGAAQISGFAKGSGMIAPNMATMLAFILTDAKIPQQNLQKMWAKICDETFNQVSVDGCQSTSDIALIISSGAKKVDEKIFEKKIFAVAENLTKKIAGDGEGATKLIEVVARNCPSKSFARKISKKVANSNLIKTAVAGRDANWGRIIQALGDAGQIFNAGKVDIFLDGQKVFFAGNPTENFDAGKIFQKFEVEILIDFHAGNFAAKSWGCDLTKKYVEINAEYST
jgi:glutamate N-acetyltransferase/amino-acid N-acetyltransferase